MSSGAQARLTGGGEDMRRRKLRPKHRSLACLGSLVDGWSRSGWLDSVLYAGCQKTLGCDQRTSPPVVRMSDRGSTQGFQNVRMSVVATFPSHLLPFPGPVPVSSTEGSRRPSKGKEGQKAGTDGDGGVGVDAIVVCVCVCVCVCLKAASLPLAPPPILNIMAASRHRLVGYATAEGASKSAWKVLRKRRPLCATEHQLRSAATVLQWHTVVLLGAALRRD
ncbi:hypothetical protein LZ30DRAFT_296769 [Colletotrichum cereale]|nr:hypothetical protein LZ30DRAFT_296769 [Colletotrichum cereale]